MLSGRLPKGGRQPGCFTNLWVNYRSRGGEGGEGSGGGGEEKGGERIGRECADHVELLCLIYNIINTPKKCS